MNEIELQRMMVRLVGDGSSYSSMLNVAQAATGKFVGSISQVSDKTVQYSNQINSYARSFISMGMGMVGLGGMVSTAMNSVQLAANLEENEIAFGTMMQDMEKGKRLVSDIQTLAAKTPMSNQVLQQSAKMLLQGRVEGENLIPIMKMLGDVTGGNSEKMMTLSYAFQQAHNMGKLMGGELMQMQNAGFNPLAILAGDSTKKMEELRKKMENGQFTISMLIEAFKKATSEGGQFTGMMEKQSQSLKGLFSTLQDDIDMFLTEIGKSISSGLNLKGLMKDVSSVMGMMRDWFMGLSEGAKQAVFSFVGVAVALGVLIVGFFVLKGVVTAVFGGLNLIMAAVITSLIGIAAGSTAIVASMGGFVGLWGRVKQGAIDFWNWLKPIRQAAYGIWEALTVQGEALWERLKLGAQEAWQRISGSVDVNWDKIRDSIRDALYFAEYAILNYESVADLVWKYLKYKAVEAFELWKWWLTAPLVGAFEYLTQNWKAVWEGTMNYLVSTATNSFQFISQGWINQAKVLKGEMTPAQFFSEFGEGLSTLAQKNAQALQESMNNLPEFKLPEREKSELEQQLQAEYEKVKGSTNQTFEEFKRQKMLRDAFRRLFSGGEKDVENVNMNLKGIQDQATGAARAIERFDAALFHSAETVTRLENYKDMFMGVSKAVTEGTSGATQKIEAGISASFASSSTDNDPVVTVLDKIYEEIKEGNRSDPHSQKIEAGIGL